MLLKDFYKIVSTSREGERLDVRIFVNKGHPIFKGHFPDNPVMPGVCILQITKELIEEAVGSQLLMSQSRNIKFKAIINPEKTPELLMQLTLQDEGDVVKVKNTTRFETVVTTPSEPSGNGSTVALQLSATFKKLN